jgi:hypothetical protein
MIQAPSSELRRSRWPGRPPLAGRPDRNPRSTSSPWPPTCIAHVAAQRVDRLVPADVDHLEQGGTTGGGGREGQSEGCVLKTRRGRASGAPHGPSRSGRRSATPVDLGSDSRLCPPYEISGLQRCRPRPRLVRGHFGRRPRREHGWGRWTGENLLLIGRLPLRSGSRLAPGQFGRICHSQHTRSFL